MSLLTIAASLTAAAIAAAFAATLLGHESNAVYVGCAVAAGAGLLLMVWHLARTRTQSDASGFYALAPMAIVVSLLGIAASGATCGVACIAWGTPAAAVAMTAPDLRGWFSKKRTRRQPLRRVSSD